MFETDKIKKRGHSHTLSFLLKLPRNSGAFFQKEGKEKKIIPLWFLISSEVYLEFE